MPNGREVFTILELSTGAGTPLVGKVAGDAVSTEKKVPAIIGIDTAGNYQMLPVKAGGDAVGNAVPSLPAKDLAGLLQYIALRDAGAAASGVDSVVVLPAKDESGNLQYIPMVGGKIAVTTEAAGTKVDDTAIATGIINTAVDVVTLSLTASKNFDEPEVVTSCSFTTYWELVQVDDATTTIHARWMTGPGMFSFDKVFKSIEFASGGTGTQSLILRGKQLQGNASDLNGYLGVLELA